MACVLVVDDDPDLLESMAMVLVQEGHVMAVATTHSEALACVRHGVPRLVLVDYYIPGIAIPELVRELRQAGAAAIVLSTAAADAETLGHVAGADEILRKPFTVDGLLTLVARYCGE